MQPAQLLRKALFRGIVETGAEVKVPLFINEGDLIKVDTQTGSYKERVNQ